VSLVAFIGEQMGGVIARARLAEQSQMAVRRMETLKAVTEAISAETYLERTLQGISDMLADILDSAVCSILLVGEKKKELTVEAARCSAPHYMHRMPIRLEGSLIEHVMENGHPVFIPNIHSGKQYRYPELARKSGLMSLLATPLTSRSRVIGAINIYTREERNFDDTEIGFVKVVAGQAAIAIQNARLMSGAIDMKRMLDSRKLIERAKGILQHKHNLTEEEAYLRLRNESRRLRRSMGDLAGEMLGKAEV
jgi:GAF domain-containing protein